MIIKKWLLLSLIVSLLAIPCTLTAQTGKMDDEEFAVEAVLLKRNLDFQNIPGSLNIDEANTSYGFRMSYWHSIGKKDRRGDFGVGVEGGATFHDYAGSTVALGRGQYAIRLQANGNDTYKPFVKGTVGIARENFKQITLCQGAGGSVGFCGAEWSETFGGGVGLDIGDRRRARIGVEYFRTSFGRASPQHNVEASFGIVF